VCEVVDVVEPVEKFANEATKAKLSEREGGRYVVSLDWRTGNQQRRRMI
jgi:hypothetical protein